MRFWLSYFLLLCATATAPMLAAQEVLHLAVDRNCPVICDPDESGQQGYAVDIVEAVFAEVDVALRVQLVPYARMAQMIQSGQADAAIYLSLSAQALQRVNIAQTPIRQQTFAVLRRKNFAFTYTDWNSLEDVVLGVPVTVSGSEPDFYPADLIARKQAAGTLVRIAGDNPMPRVLKMVARSRLDIFPGEEDALRYYLQQMPHRGQLVVDPISSIPASPLQLVIHANHAKAETYVTHFDVTLPRLRKSGAVAEILSRYGLTE